MLNTNKKMVLVIPLRGAQEAEREYPYPLELVGPFLHSLHSNDPEAFYDHIVQCVDEINEDDPVFQSFLAEDKHEMSAYNRTLDVYCTQADRAMDQMRNSLIGSYSSSPTLSHYLSSHVVSEVRMLDASTAVLKMDPVE